MICGSQRITGSWILWAPMKGIWWHLHVWSSIITILQSWQVIRLLDVQRYGSPVSICFAFHSINICKTKNWWKKETCDVRPWRLTHLSFHSLLWVLACDSSFPVPEYRNWWRRSQASVERQKSFEEEWKHKIMDFCNGKLLSDVRSHFPFVCIL